MDVSAENYAGRFGGVAESAHRRNVLFCSVLPVMSTDHLWSLLTYTGGNEACAAQLKKKKKKEGKTYILKINRT
jgi:hypothetical protein